MALLIFAHWIARLFTPEADVIAAGVVLLRIAAFFPTIRRLAGGRDGRLARRGRYPDPDVLSLHRILADRTAAGFVIVFPVRDGRAGVVDRVIGRVGGDWVVLVSLEKEEPGARLRTQSSTGETRDSNRCALNRFGHR